MIIASTQEMSDAKLFGTYFGGYFWVSSIQYSVRPITGEELKINFHFFVVLFKIKANGYFSANWNNYYNFADGTTISVGTSYYSGAGPISGNTNYAMAISSSGISPQLISNLYNYVCQYGS